MSRESSYSAKARVFGSIVYLGKISQAVSKENREFDSNDTAIDTTYLFFIKLPSKY